NPTPSTTGQTDIHNIAVNYDDLPDFEPASTPAKIQKNKGGEQQKNKNAPEKLAKTSSLSSAKNPSDNLFSIAPKTRKKNDLNPPKKSLNDQLNRNLKFGLNDRLTYVNQLFEGSATDFNRVVSQLNTLEDFAQAKSFIEE